MRQKKSHDGLTALAIAGSYVVLVGWDLSAKTIKSEKILGFSLQRHRHSDGERIWMPGMKTFEAVDPDPEPGVPVSSFVHPLQTFQWSDYTAKPGETYTYRLVARKGTPTALADGPELSLTVTTEPTDTGKHAVFFNRGAVASQEYARHFQNRKPSEVGQSAYDWLSRGLVEALEKFILQAGSGDELFGAFYEFKNTRVYDALKKAKRAGAKVHILYDGRQQKAKNEAAMKGEGIASVAKPRKHPGALSHNKFLVFCRNGRPAEVWTGATNLSENGIFGHSNNAHIVRDRAIARQFLGYWKILNQDLTRAPTVAKIMVENPIPPTAPSDVIPVFSPRSDLSVLNKYAEMAGGADRALFMTFAFGMHDSFAAIYETRDDVLRFALMEKKGNGRKIKEQSKVIDRIRKLPNTIVSVGNKVKLNNFDRWLEEIDEITDDAHVLYVHTKYMLIDPLGPKPIIVVGSANFSEPSTDKNDENMLVIEGNKSLADIYLGEFMRLFSHYAFRESLSFRRRQTEAEKLLRKFLIDSPNWIDGSKPNESYFKTGNDRTLRRLYFSGQ
jgi:phosphatidylserine/phosphatidylglycerophosphate/cardiolipin synthase-like enzyme